MPLAAKKGHNGQKTWAKRWSRMSITTPNWAKLLCTQHMASTIEKVELTGDVWRPKNAMDEGADVLCYYYYYYYVEWGPEKAEGISALTEWGRGAVTGWCGVTGKTREVET